MIDFYGGAPFSSVVRYARDRPHLMKYVHEGSTDCYKHMYTEIVGFQS